MAPITLKDEQNQSASDNSKLLRKKLPCGHELLDSSPHESWSGSDILSSQVLDKLFDYFVNHTDIR